MRITFTAIALVSLTACGSADEPFPGLLGEGTVNQSEDSVALPDAGTTSTPDSSTAFAVVPPASPVTVQDASTTVAEASTPIADAASPTDSGSDAGRAVYSECDPTTVQCASGLVCEGFGNPMFLHYFCTPSDICGVYPDGGTFGASCPTGGHCDATKSYCAPDSE